MDLRDVKEFLKDSLKYIIVIAVVFLIAMFGFSFQQVIGPSMNNTLEDRDVVIVNKILAKISSIKRGDILVVEANEKYMIKRVIGLPGEKIEYKDHQLYINDKLVNEDYLSSETDDFDTTYLGFDTIPKDTYFVMGDNRADSYDSRDFGVVKKKEIVGYANFRIFPLNKIGFIK